MPSDAPRQSGRDAVLAMRNHLGGDLWTTPDRRLQKGGPFSAIEAPLLLLELGADPREPVLREATDLIFSAWREDGRFKLSPEGAMYPCQTIHALRTLCCLGYAADARLANTFAHLLAIQHGDGGWRCLKFSFGRGPETEFSNPGPTLMALDAFRFTPMLNHSDALDRAVEFLLAHFVTRKPLGPCHYGIGTQFMQVAYPFLTYNLFYYVYVLSFFDRAKEDARFLEALAILEAKLAGGQIVTERPHPKLKEFAFCKKGEPSAPGTLRLQEIWGNLGRGTAR